MEVMFTPEIYRVPKKKVSGTVSLKRMVSHLLYAFQPAAARHNSFFVNEIPADFFVNVDRDMLAAVISELLTAALHKTKNSCIQLNVKRYSDIVLFRLKDSNTENAVHFDYNWREVHPLVEKLGGCITTGETRKKTSTITLSFRSLQNLA